MAEIGVMISRGYSSGSFTIPDEQFYIFSQYISIGATDVLTILGSGHLSII